MPLVENDHLVCCTTHTTNTAKTRTHHVAHALVAIVELEGDKTYGTGGEYHAGRETER